MKRYCIREDYVPRTEAVTYVEDPIDYWNKTRIRTSSFYQYYVYKEAAERAARMEPCAFADIGCGYPRKVKELILPITKDVTLVDQPSMERLIKSDFPEMRFVPLDLESGVLSLERTFNCIICADVIEHLLDPDPLMAFIREVLAPGGLAVVSTPERDMKRGVDCLASPSAEHVREWNQAELAEYLVLCGFEVVEHLLLPKGRLLKLEDLALPLIRRLDPKRYLSCQTAFCTVKDDR